MGYAAPSVESVDALIKLLKVEGSAVPVIMSDQTGQGRASTAAVMAGVIKEAQLETEFAKMRGIVPDCILDSLRAKKLHPEPAPRGKDANALMLGEFPVVMDQIEKYFILVVFALYCKVTGPAGFSPSWSSWFASSPYPDQIASGKSKLEWERKVPGEQITALKKLMDVDDFNENLP